MCSQPQSFDNDPESVRSKQIGPNPAYGHVQEPENVIAVNNPLYGADTHGYENPLARDEHGFDPDEDEKIDFDDMVDNYTENYDDPIDTGKYDEPIDIGKPHYDEPIDSGKYDEPIDIGKPLKGKSRKYQYKEPIGKQRRNKSTKHQYDKPIDNGKYDEPIDIGKPHHDKSTGIGKHQYDETIDIGKRHKDKPIIKQYYDEIVDSDEEEFDDLRKKDSHISVIDSEGYDVLRTDYLYENSAPVYSDDVTLIN